METMTATEAAKTFGLLLDKVIGGETVQITKQGRVVAEISKAPATPREDRP